MLFSIVLLILNELMDRTPTGNTEENIVSLSSPKMLNINNQRKLLRANFEQISSTNVFPILLTRLPRSF